MRSQEMEATFRPNLNFLLLVQLELSVNASSPNVPTPSFSITCSEFVSEKQNIICRDEVGIFFRGIEFEELKI